MRNLTYKEIKERLKEIYPDMRIIRHDYYEIEKTRIEIKATVDFKEKNSRYSAIIFGDGTCQIYNNYFMKINLHDDYKTFYF